MDVYVCNVSSSYGQEPNYCNQDIDMIIFPSSPNFSLNEKMKLKIENDNVKIQIYLYL